MRSALSVLGICFLASQFASADSYVLRPVSDRDGASQVSPDQGPWELRPDGGGGLIVGSGFSGGFWRTALEFDIRAISGIVTEAKLRYQREVTANPPAAYRTHGYLGDGAVSAADLGVNNEISPVRTTNDPPEVDVTDYVKNAVAQRGTHVGITLSGFAGGSGFAIRSSEPFVGAPTLNITTIPEPSGALVLGAALLVTVRRRCRRA